MRLSEELMYNLFEYAEAGLPKSTDLVRTARVRG